MTPREFQMYVEGYEWREDREYEKLALLTSYLISPHVKRGRAPSPKKLFDRWRKKPSKGADGTQFLSEQEKFKALWAKVELNRRREAMEAARKARLEKAARWTGLIREE